jgi:predicted transcriptional regulator
MTTAHHINNTAILPLLLRNKSFNPIMKQYGINYNCVTVLLSAYYYNTFVKDKFSITGLYTFINYYNHYRLIGYINKLVSIGLITLAGPRKYKLTPEGIQVIQSISVNMDQILYKFCNDHDIEL